MKSPSPAVKPKHRLPVKKKSVDWMEWAKLLAPIAASLVLGISGGIIQHRVSEAALNKDYVATALTILKEPPTQQNAELRDWALKVFAEYSPLTLPNEAKESLFKGQVVLAGLPYYPPPAGCMVPPQGKPIQLDTEKLIPALGEATRSNAALQLLVDFAELATKESLVSVMDRARQQCLIDWMEQLEKDDIEFRSKIGADSSKELIARFRREPNANGVATAASAASAPKSQ